VNRGLKTADVFHWEVLSIGSTKDIRIGDYVGRVQNSSKGLPCVEVLVERGKNLRIEDLESSDAVDHAFQGLFG
jgi:hypothetical protein